MSELQQAEETTKTVVFDERGQEVEEPTAEEVAEVAEETTESPAQKYRIGDKMFATQEEALAYAQSTVSALETETQVSDAYRQGMKDALLRGPSTENVTPTVQDDGIDTEELYTNPKAFVEKIKARTKDEIRAEFQQQEATRTQSDQIWREFTDRHPQLADFRGEVENFVNQHVTEVRAIIGTKGQGAGYDWVATKLKSRFEAYANALKAKRALPNSGSSMPATQKAASVTPKKEEKKPLSFVEQIRSIRKRR